MGIFNYVVFAGLSPTAWIWIGRARPSEGAVLHRISLNREEASRCVVAEQYFDPSEKEIDEYLMRTGRKRIGSLNGYSREQYPLSFIPLPEYDDEHNMPEVLIPFEVEANVDWIRTYWVRLGETQSPIARAPNINPLKKPIAFSPTCSINLSNPSYGVINCFISTSSVFFLPFINVLISGLGRARHKILILASSVLEA